MPCPDQISLPSRATRCPAMPSHARPSRALPRNPRLAMPSHAKPNRAMLCQAMPRRAMPCLAMYSQRLHQLLLLQHPITLHLRRPVMQRQLGRSHRQMRLLRLCHPLHHIRYPPQQIRVPFVDLLQLLVHPIKRLSVLHHIGRIFPRHLSLSSRPGPRFRFRLPPTGN